jgi:hypothetical protein
VQKDYLSGFLKNPKGKMPLPELPKFDFLETIAREEQLQKALKIKSELAKKKAEKAALSKASASKTPHPVSSHFLFYSFLSHNLLLLSGIFLQTSSSSKGGTR